MKTGVQISNAHGNGDHQWAKAFAPKPNDMSLIPRTANGWRKKTNSFKLSPDHGLHTTAPTLRSPRHGTHTMATASMPRHLYHIHTKLNISIQKKSFLKQSGVGHACSPSSGIVEATETGGFPGVHWPSNCSFLESERETLW